MPACTHCGDSIPDTKRAGTRFCKPACRINHHVKNRPEPTLTDDVVLNAAEAELLIDAAEPWGLYVASRKPEIGHPVWGFAAHGKPVSPKSVAAWSAYRARQARAKRVQRAWRRLAALGLVRVGRLHPSYGRTVIERTDTGTALLGRRHNKLHAIAEHGNGEPVAGMVLWRGGGLHACRR